MDQLPVTVAALLVADACNVGLVLNAVVLWNTRHIDLAVNVLRGQGYPVRDEDAGL
jgi:TnpA family transposase